MAVARRSLGDGRGALAALAEASKLGDCEASLASIELQRAELAAAGPDAASARARVESVLASARDHNDEATAAEALLVLGAIAENSGDDALALSFSSDAAGALSARPLVRANAGIRRGRLLAGSGNREAALRAIAAAVDLLGSSAPDHDVAYATIAAGRALLDLDRSRASALCSQAESIGARLGDARASAQAHACLAVAAERDGRDSEGLEATRSALLAIGNRKEPELVFDLEWTRARLLVAAGNEDEALQAYRRAASSLAPIRPALAARDSARGLSFRREHGRVLVELVDRLLHRAASLEAAGSEQPFLAEARRTMEALKAAELEDYFRDTCVETNRSRGATLEAVGSGTAVIYPILLDDRIELLVGTAAGLKRRSVAVPRARAEAEIEDYRLLLQKRTTREYLPHARRLYDWLVRPLLPLLEGSGVKTLVFVPDGSLLTVPMAALHDGRDFLVQRYALAVTPGIDLTDARPFDGSKASLLVAGITESVAGFPALPNVGAETADLHGLYGGALFIDKAFRFGALHDELASRPASVVHIASHGEFHHDVADTFLLTYDGRIDMNQLGDLVALARERDQPLELLTLSACQTAAGDERAALGLAGVAIKAGAKSALATLWFVNDRATSELVDRFYRGIREPGLSKASALQAAQVELIADARYRHPTYWAGFLLINNWL